MHESDHDTIWIHNLYQSQFDLLNAMSEELCEAFNAKGYTAKLRNLAPDSMPTEGTMFFMNTDDSLSGMPPELLEQGSVMRAIQYYVDHPFGLSDGSIDKWNQINHLENYRLALPCIDDAHLLRYRFPNLVHGWVPSHARRCAIPNHSRLRTTRTESSMSSSPVRCGARSRSTKRSRRSRTPPSHR